MSFMAVKCTDEGEEKKCGNCKNYRGFQLASGKLESNRRDDWQIFVKQEICLSEMFQRPRVAGGVDSVGRNYHHHIHYVVMLNKCNLMRSQWTYEEEILCNLPQAGIQVAISILGNRWHFKRYLFQMIRLSSTDDDFCCCCCSCCSYEEYIHNATMISKMAIDAVEKKATERHLRSHHLLRLLCFLSPPRPR